MAFLSLRGGVDCRVSDWRPCGLLLSQGLRDRIKRTEINQFPDNLSDHLPVTIDIELYLSDDCPSVSNYLPMSINWSRITVDTKQQYESIMEDSLNAINVPFHSLLHGNSICECEEHIFCIERYFEDILKAITTASKCLPKSRPGISKDYWSESLSSKKYASYDAHKIWCDNGKPCSGPLFELKKKAFYDYILSIKRAKSDFDQSRVDEMHHSITSKDSNRFWQQWQSLHGKKNDHCTRINGKIIHKEIANDFAASFSRIYNEARSVQAQHLSDKFDLLFPDIYWRHLNDDISGQFLSWDNMLQVMAKLKPGKSSASSIKAEHILHGSPLLTIHIHLLSEGCDFSYYQR